MDVRDTMPASAIGKKVYGIIYAITNSVNNKIYIGQTTQTLNSRISQHRSAVKKGTTPLCKAMAAYGPEKFSAHIIDYASTKEQLDKLEISHIMQYKAMVYDNGYNVKLPVVDSLGGFFHCIKDAAKHHRISGSNIYNMILGNTDSFKDGLSFRVATTWSWKQNEMQGIPKRNISFVGVVKEYCDAMKVRNENTEERIFDFDAVSGLADGDQVEFAHLTKDRVTRRIKALAFRLAELISGSNDPEHAFEQAYRLAKLALDNDVGRSSRHDISELKTSMAYIEALDYVCEVVGKSAEKRLARIISKESMSQFGLGF